jgi:4-amino-4-deoxy-L-arabinose transferase-like glycosyltransferase
MGRLFCAVWGVSILLFPFYKGIPAGLIPIFAGCVLAAVVSAHRQRLSAWLARATPARFLVVVVSMAAAVRLAAAWYYPLAPANDHEMFYRLAASLATGDGYGWGHGPSAFFPPGMPLLLAVVFKVFGVGYVVAKAVGIGVGVGLVVATYAFARAHTTELIARWTTLLTAFSPTLIAYGVTVGYEPLLACVILAWASMTWTLSRDTSVRPQQAVVLGALCGVGTLIKPICLLLPVMSFGFWLGPRRPLGALVRAGVCALAMLLVVLPWTLRNWKALGTPVLVSTNGGVVLYSANHTGSRGIATPVEPLPGETDEVARDQVRQRAAVAWIRSHPREFLALMIPKSVYGWGTTSSIMSFVSYDRLPPRQEDISKALLNVGWGALFLLCGLAAWKTRIWTEPSIAPAIGFLVYLAAVHLVYEALSRHHVTVLPILSLTAGAWLASNGSSPASDDSHLKGSSTPS